MDDLLDAIEDGDLDEVSYLLSSSSSSSLDVNTVDDAGLSTLAFAVELGQTAIVELLVKEYHADVNQGVGTSTAPLVSKKSGNGEIVIGETF